jgi:hypothetical protein
MPRALDDQIQDIEKLDKLRQHARDLQLEAIEALTAKPYQRRPRTIDPPAVVAVSQRENWNPPGDDIEKANLLCALSKRLEPKEAESRRQLNASRTDLINDLSAITYAELDPALHMDVVPIFRSARVLRALAETPDKVFSTGALVCLCRIVWELNEITAPTWSGGAARAGDQAIATAFVTGECARALLAVAEALDKTAEAADVLAKEAARPRTTFAAWQEQEDRFRKESLDISLSALQPRLILRLDRAGNPSPAEMLDQIKAYLATSIPAIGSLNIPRGATPTPRATDGPRKIAPPHYDRTAKEIAWAVGKRFLDAIRGPIPDTSPEAVGKRISERLRRGSQIIRELVEPIESFAESCIDRQLAATSPAFQVTVDAAELVFAATLYGRVTDWKRPKVKAAWSVLKPMLSANGRLPSVRPFDVRQEDGYRLNVQTLEVTRRLADLIAKLDVEVEPDFVQRMLLPFDYTRVPATNKKESGWTTDPPARKVTSLWWLTAIAVDALDSIIRMLDEIINREILRNFQVREPTSLKLGLDDLFYPDFGLARLHDKPSIAEELQKLRAHAGFGPPDDRPLFSMILHGPPGTGKTTLVEAVAKSAQVPLVEVTPSDILVGGTEGVERRTRNVFQALSKLTNAVILFDEFDSILLDRNKRDPDAIPRSVIEFLTPGMLPKLKALNDASKLQRVSFVLATNFVDRLDSAVTRGGRFDAKHGVFPPDVVSRLGRLIGQLDKSEPKLTSLETQLEEQVRAETNPGRRGELERELQLLRRRAQPSTRIPQVLGGVLQTAGGAMDRLGKIGWYTAPRETKDFENTLFGGVLMNRDYPKGEAEASYERELDNYRRQLAKREGKTFEEVKDQKPPPDEYWVHWRLIVFWESELETKIGALWRRGAAPAWDEVYRFVEALPAPPPDPPAPVATATP